MAVHLVVVSSVVADVIMPPIGLLLGGVGLPILKITLKDSVFDEIQVRSLARQFRLTMETFCKQLRRTFNHCLRHFPDGKRDEPLNAQRRETG